ncbi:S-layer family protein [Aneurinibacillus soli]|uniref:Endo-1,4-beta-xylanase A n=1 Tax=Aneurinibacillus soli TaxID=1500254 RepID=A0A0U5BFP2_9BACL|nr:S-layer homology domain-containing protein [Aneurinibacillus soli]PYE60656.1 S-layer family protein [Aneurinibacillus soli]BAU29820.1 Endo-1,4-beta-xylanase A precursor [Aneurinibacillus soli]
MDKRRILKTAIITSLLSSYVFPRYGAASFNDVEDSFAKDAIFQLANKEIISGKGNGKFDPKGYVTRQDFAIILAKALDLDISDSRAIPTFSDIPPSHYAYKYVEAVAKAGLIKGNKNGQFGNGEKLSRQDMAVILVRALGINPVGEAKNIKFKDDNPHNSPHTFSTP